MWMQGVSPVGPVEVLQSEEARALLDCNDQVYLCSHPSHFAPLLQYLLLSITDMMSGTPSLKITEESWDNGVSPRVARVYWDMNLGMCAGR